MRTRALLIPVGDLLIGWAWAHVTDMWLYWRSPPGCHWRRNGGAAGLGNGVSAGATIALLAAEGGGRGFPSHCLKPVAFPWHRVYCHMPSQEAGASPPFPPLQHRRWISCASDPGFLTEEEEGGRGRSLKGSLVRKLFLKLEEVLFL